MMTNEDVVLFIKDVSREWAAALAPVMAGIERAAVHDDSDSRKRRVGRCRDIAVESPGSDSHFDAPVNEEC